MDTKSPRKILVATDFSEASDEAIDRAIELAKQASCPVLTVPYSRKAAA